MKMKVFMRRINGRIVRKTVTATESFTMYGYTFAAHSWIDEYGKVNRDKFTVSELRTGYHVSDGKTKNEAIQNAIQRLEDCGKRKTDAAMKRAIDEVTA